MNQGDKIYANTPSSGTPLGFNSLFERLENLRQMHYNSSNQLNASAISNSINTQETTQGLKPTPQNIQNLNTELDTLKKSTWYEDNTDPGLSPTETTLEKQYNLNFPVPSVGELITAGNFNTISDQLSVIENICPNYSSKYNSFYSSFYSGRYSGFYTSFYSSQYSTQYDNRYSGQYSSFYSSDYSGRYSGRYSSFYSSFYSARYGSKYSAAYSGAYGGFYSSRYSSRYSNRYSSFYHSRSTVK